MDLIHYKLPIPAHGGPRKSQPKCFIGSLVENPNFQVYIKVHGPRKLIKDKHGIKIRVTPNQETWLDVFQKLQINVAVTGMDWYIEALRHRTSGPARAELNDKVIVHVKCVAVIIKDFVRTQLKQFFSVYIMSDRQRGGALRKEDGASVSLVLPPVEQPSLGQNNGGRMGHLLEMGSFIPLSNIVLQTPEHQVEAYYHPQSTSERAMNLNPTVYGWNHIGTAEIFAPQLQYQLADPLASNVCFGAILPVAPGTSP